jgi:hypothetical protein
VVSYDCNPFAHTCNVVSGTQGAFSSLALCQSNCEPPKPPVAGVTWRVGVADCSTVHAGTLPAPLPADDTLVVAWQGGCGVLGTVKLQCVRRGDTGELVALYDQSAAGGHRAEGLPTQGQAGCSNVSYRAAGGSSRCCFP